jgi:hypothetical protein
MKRGSTGLCRPTLTPAELHAVYEACDFARKMLPIHVNPPEALVTAIAKLGEARARSEIRAIRGEVLRMALGKGESS